jgi:hypothetical protein
MAYFQANLQGSESYKPSISTIRRLLRIFKDFKPLLEVLKQCLIRHSSIGQESDHVLMCLVQLHKTKVELCDDFLYYTMMTVLQVLEADSLAV